jgi:hypothetical protein
MATKSRRILLQMGIVSTISTIALATILVLKFDIVLDWAQGDYRPLLLNGIILGLFLLGAMQLFRAVRHYQHQEKQIRRYIRRRQEGEDSSQALEDMPPSSLLADRFHTMRELFDNGTPVDHGAISAIMTAEESLHQSFPRFVNNVLILTGVFGTVTSLILALVGAGDVLQANSTDAGMGLLLLGMNTALTTTATAIVCYFFFTFFFHRLTDLQTWVFSQVERACLLYMVPEFISEPEAINHQTKLLIEDVRKMVREVREGIGGIDEKLRWDPRDDHAPALLDGMERQNSALEAALTRLDQIQQTLVEGFRLIR